MSTTGANYLVHRALILKCYVFKYHSFKNIEYYYSFPVWIRICIKIIICIVYMCVCILQLPFICVTVKVHTTGVVLKRFRNCTVKNRQVFNLLFSEPHWLLFSHCDNYLLAVMQD